MKVSQKRMFLMAAAATATAIAGGLAQAENYYFRLRPSISILNQESFSVRIDGDRAGVVGSRFAAKAEASSPRETLRFSVTDGALPPGVALNESSGTISGNPTVKGRFSAVVTAQDAFSTASAPLSVTVYDELTVESTVPPYATVGQPYSGSFKGIGGDGNFAWTLSGTQPSGLSFGNVTAASATLLGTPTAAGSWSGLRASLSDGAGHNASSSLFSIVVADPLKLAGNPSNFATIGETYSTTFTTAGGHPDIQWSMSGTLPEGIQFNDGAISGIPTKSETASNLVVKVTDAAGNSMSSDPFSIAVSQPLSAFGNPPDFATIGVSYSATFTASGGDGHYTWSLARGTLPRNLTAVGGTISGVPTEVGTSSDIVLRVTDGNGRSAESQPFSIAVSNPLSLTGSAPKVATVGVWYASDYAVSGGDGNYTWSVVSGPEPTGLYVVNGLPDGYGFFRGTPSKTGTWNNIVLRVTDGNGRTIDTNPFSIVVRSPLAISGSASFVATVGEWRTTDFAVSGGDGSYTWSVVGGTEPPGFYVVNGLNDGYGFYRGTPTAAGTWSNIVLRVTDGDGRTADTNPFSIVVSNSLTLSGMPSSIATVGTFYSASLTAGGGNGSYTWAVVSGSLPTGLTLSNGVISGTPTTAGTFSGIVVRVTDGNGRTKQSDPFSIVVSGPLKIASLPSSVATVGTAYSSTLTASGGNGSYTWTLVGGSLPYGLTPSGATIYGTPTTAYTWSNIVFRVTDGNGRTADTNPFSIAVANPLSITAYPSSVGTVGAYYSSAMSASGGDGNYSWTLIGGSLPYGLYASGATIYGTPTTAYTWSNIVYRVSDGSGRSVQTSPFYISIYDPVSISGTLASSAKVGTYYQSSVSAYGGTGSYNWYIAGGSLPSGLYHSGGTVYGTPTATGTWYVALQAIDGHGRSAQTATMTISVAPNIIREPSSGEYCSFNSYDWRQRTDGYNANIWWNGGSVGASTDVNATSFSYGGATYYRGTYFGNWSGLINLYCVYRTIP